MVTSPGQELLVKLFVTG